MGAAGSSKGSQVCSYRKGKKNNCNASAVFLISAASVYISTTD